jgi:hypothetical protein
LWHIPKYNVGLVPALVTRQPREVNGHHAPTGQSREQATDAVCNIGE